jgi:hypothetical protein
MTFDAVAESSKKLGASASAIGTEQTHTVVAGPGAERMLDGDQREFTPLQALQSQTS